MTLTTLSKYTLLLLFDRPHGISTRAPTLVRSHVDQQQHGHLDRSLRRQLPPADQRQQRPICRVSPLAQPDANRDRKRRKSLAEVFPSIPDRARGGAEAQRVPQPESLLRQQRELPSQALRGQQHQRRRRRQQHFLSAVVFAAAAVQHGKLPPPVAATERLRV